MKTRTSPIILSITLLMFSLSAHGCATTDSNTNSTTSHTGNQSSGGNANSATSIAGNQNGGVGNSSSPTAIASPSASPMPLPNALPVRDSWLQAATNVRAQIGQRYNVTCSPNLRLSESVYNIGDVYYSGSSICSSAVHAGVITQTQGGQVTIEIRPAPATSYTAGEARNGVTPRAMGFKDQVDNGGFVFIKP